MSAFGGLIITNRGRALQAKAQLGTPLVFTRMSLGDGELGGSSIVDMTAMKHEVKSLGLSRFQLLNDGKARIGALLSNQDIGTGFYWRELGIFATDPDLGEILYCYGNSGANAEYIPAGGGPDIIEKWIDVITLVANATSVSAVIDESLIYMTTAEFQNHLNAQDPHPQYATSEEVGSLITTHINAIDPHPQYETSAEAQSKADAAAAAGVAAAAVVQDNLDAHLADKAPHIVPAAHVYHSTNQSIATASITSLAFNSERYDTENIHDTVTNNSRLTCKTAGKYRITLNLYWDINSVGARQGIIKVNGSVELAKPQIVPVNGGYTGQSISGTYTLAVDDYVEAFVYQSSGGALNIISGATNFEMERVG